MCCPRKEYPTVYLGRISGDIRRGLLVTAADRVVQNSYRKKARAAPSMSGTKVCQLD
jgi:hypothetical protein